MGTHPPAGELLYYGRSSASFGALPTLPIGSLAFHRKGDGFGMKTPRVRRTWKEESWTTVALQKPDPKVPGRG